ncbi:MAG: glycosyltransferase [Methylomicrobium sp.]|nr:glycosyltransferase [Methylomicrobium sp.]
MIEINLNTLILQLRTDLREHLGEASHESSAAYLAWLLTNGLHEYPALRQNQQFLSRLASLLASLDVSHSCLTPLQFVIWQARPDIQALFPLPEQLMDFYQWFYTYGLEDHDYWFFLSEREKNIVKKIPAPWPARLSKIIAPDTPPKAPKIPFSKRPFGVNLVGYAFGQLGIGEDVRMAARALLAANVPMTMLDFPPGSDVPQNDRSMERYVSEQGPFGFNIFCMTAEEHGRFYLNCGESQLQDRYTIGYWPWELGNWPKNWEMMLEFVDEVWVSTRHIYDALAPVCHKPLMVMPMTVELGSITRFSSRKRAREHFGLPEKAKLFCFSLDLKSYFQRKNPQACIDAFLDAFPTDQYTEKQVGLVIKAHKPAMKDLNWERLKKLAARDKRIKIIEGTLSRPDLLALYQACDCFVSLHRAEGFGRGIAEALQLGLYVITTGYSGNVDFCKAPHADLVRYRLINVEKGQYPYPDGQVWADPDISHAAELMRCFVRGKKSAIKKTDWPEFSAGEVGQRYKTRLEVIYDEKLRASDNTLASFTAKIVAPEQPQ